MWTISSLYAPLIQQDINIRAPLSLVDRNKLLTNGSDHKSNQMKYWKLGFNEWLFVCCFSSFQECVTHTMYMASLFLMKGDAYIYSLAHNAPSYKLWSQGVWIYWTSASAGCLWLLLHFPLFPKVLSKTYPQQRNIDVSSQTVTIHLRPGTSQYNIPCWPLICISYWFP